MSSKNADFPMRSREVLIKTVVDLLSVHNSSLLMATRAKSKKTASVPAPDPADSTERP